jgi:hypothetical protein
MRTAENLEWTNDGFAFPVFPSHFVLFPGSHCRDDDDLSRPFRAVRDT